MPRGYIYILTNKSFPKLIKIGMTTRSVKLRAQELSNHTGVPTPYVVEYEIQVEDCAKLEPIIHRKLKRYRLAKEFFALSVGDAKEIIGEISERFKTTSGKPSELSTNGVGLTREDRIKKHLNNASSKPQTPKVGSELHYARLQHSKVGSELSVTGVGLTREDRIKKHLNDALSKSQPSKVGFKNLY
ncbi:MAG: GIY-YIG nuclease family protein [Syntrophobacteraceae bacterium]